MDIKIYNNTIIVPVKCGTRYLDKVWENERIELSHVQYLRFPKVKYIVIREPMAHLKAAIHTQTVKFINEFGKRDIFLESLNDFINPIGTTHWCVSFYEYLYYYRNRYGEDVEIIKLENLTELLKKLGHDIEYVPEEYHFKKYKDWMSKDELFKLLMDMYPKEVNLLLDKVKIQNEYYNKLINNEIDPNSFGNKNLL
jgi:hypothetical protein